MKKVFKSGNEAAALAISQLNYDIMGYYPISPSTEVAQYLDLLSANGKCDIKLIPAEGEHSSAGVCYGAALSGARVTTATSANGLLYMIEQLPVISGTRIPMVMNLVNRATSAPLNIHCDHSDLYMTLNLGWIILCASTQQEVYDLNIMALKLAEKVELPVIVSYDGFITSHQKHNLFIQDDEKIKEFIGEKELNPNKYIMDTQKPITIGAHMLPQNFINQRYQLELSFNEIEKEFLEISKEYNLLRGKEYSSLETYNMENAETVIFVLNSASELVKESIDKLKEMGIEIGLITPKILRPFPNDAIINALKNCKSLIIMERFNTLGSNNSVLANEISNIILESKLDITIKNIIFGLGGNEIFMDDIINLVKDLPKESKSFLGITKGESDNLITNGNIIDNSLFKLGGFNYTFDEETNKLNVKVPPLRSLMKKPKRIESGHSACPGCGIFPGVEIFLRGIEGDVVLLNQTGCAYVVSANYPYSAHKGHYIHNLFQNGAATLSGLLEGILKLKNDGKIHFDDDATFIMLSGDGGLDIGLGSAMSTAIRNHNLIILEYDNEGYMNTGAQLSYTTPIGHRTSTSNIGTHSYGKKFNHKDSVQIMASTNIPYLFTGVDAYPQDLLRKAAKAQWYAKNVGMVFGKLLITCPLNWKSEEKLGSQILETAVNCNFFPLYEIENGITNITYNPIEMGNNIEVEDWLKYMYKSKHLLLPENKEVLEEFKSVVKHRFDRLQAMHDNELL